ncbi:hypothetical protein ABK040_001730 [Willaertia magna]
MEKWVIYCVPQETGVEFKVLSEVAPRRKVITKTQLFKGEKLVTKDKFLNAGIVNEIISEEEEKERLKNKNRVEKLLESTIKFTEETKENKNNIIWPESRNDVKLLGKCKNTLDPELIQQQLELAQTTITENNTNKFEHKKRIYFSNFASVVKGRQEKIDKLIYKERKRPKIITKDDSSEDEEDDISSCVVNTQEIYNFAIDFRKKAAEKFKKQKATIIDDLYYKLQC